MTLQEMIDAGWSAAQIGAALGIGKNAAWKRAKKLGGTKPRPWQDRTAAVKAARRAAEAPPPWRFEDDRRAAKAETRQRLNIAPSWVPYASSAAEAVA